MKKEVEDKVYETVKSYFDYVKDKYNIGVYYLIKSNAPNAKYVLFDKRKREILSYSSLKVVADDVAQLSKTDVNFLNNMKMLQYVISEEAIPVQGFTYRPYEDIVTNGKLNLFKPSFYMEHYSDDIKQVPFDTIDKFLRKFFETSRELKYFINRIAFNLQHPTVKVPTSMILLGVPGTGKDTLKEILKKIVGSNLSTINSSHLSSSFNAGFIANKLFVFANEVIEFRERSKVANIIKDLTTNKTIRVEEKFVPSYEIENLTNWIFATNNFRSIPLEKGDRRYSIFVQTKTLEEQLGIDFIEELYDMINAPPAIDDEFMGFYTYLMRYKTNKQLVMKPLKNVSRKNLLELYKGKFEELVEEAFREYFYADDNEYPVVEKEGETYIIASKFFDLFSKRNKNVSRSRFYLELKQSFLMDYVGIKTINGKTSTWLKIIDKGLKEKVLEYE